MSPLRIPISMLRSISDRLVLLSFLTAALFML
ncbi:MAG: hypothetical protein ACJAQ3_000091, partial [Planctomycetota bacterium]